MLAAHELCRHSETLENVANASSDALSFPRGFSSTAADLIKRLLTSVRHLPLRITLHCEYHAE